MYATSRDLPHLNPGRYQPLSTHLTCLIPIIFRNKLICPLIDGFQETPVIIYNFQIRVKNDSFSLNYFVSETNVIRHSSAHNTQ